MLAIRCPYCHTSQPLSIAEFHSEISCPSCTKIFSFPFRLRQAAAESRSSLGSPAAGSLETSPSRSTRYIVREVLREGGMGTIVRAFDITLQREVAMKVLRKNASEEEMASFLREAWCTAQIQHPNIVPIYELDCDAEGRLFFTMKLIQGRSLGEVLDFCREDPARSEKRYSLRRLLGVLIRVSDAIAFAHQQGVIHRDLKPENIMLGEFGEVHVVDWGLAKILPSSSMPASSSPFSTAPPSQGSYDSAGDAPFSLPSLPSPIERRAEGSPLYMAPEQARGDLDAIDVRTDVYGLGAILYEILTLHPPLSGASEEEILRHAMEARILPPKRRAPSRPIPEELAAIAMKALSKDPSNRYPSVLAFQERLKEYLDRQTLWEVEDQPLETLMRLTRRHRWGGFAAGILVMLALSVLLALRQSQIEIQKRERACAAAAQEERRRIAADLLEKAERARHRGDRMEAFLRVEIAESCDPAHPLLPLFRARLYEEMGDWERALREIEVYQEKHPEDIQGREIYLRCLARKEENTQTR